MGRPRNIKCIGFLPSNQRCTFLILIQCFTNTNDSISTHILLFGQGSLDISVNTLIFNVTIYYLISKNRFEESHFQYFAIFCYTFISLTLFRILMSFLRLYINTIHIHLVFRFFTYFFSSSQSYTCNVLRFALIIQ